jgi:probable rRNA maturation factor
MVEILDETNRYPSTRRLGKVLEDFLREQNILKTVTLVLCDDATIHAMNLSDRGEDYATDVLSYPTMEPDDTNVPEVDHLGDVFISLDTAERQAITHNHDLESEVLTLAAHGITHLRGFDHTTEAQWTMFRAAQQRVLELRAKR